MKRIVLFAALSLAGCNQGDSADQPPTRELVRVEATVEAFNRPWKITAEAAGGQSAAEQAIAAWQALLLDERAAKEAETPAR
jgi:hypothetical protein